MKDIHKPLPRGILEKSSLRVIWYPSFAGSTISRTSVEISLTICMVYDDRPDDSNTPWVSRGVDIDKQVSCGSDAEDCKKLKDDCQSYVQFQYTSKTTSILSYAQCINTDRDQYIRLHMDINFDIDIQRNMLFQISTMKFCFIS